MTNQDSSKTIASSARHFFSGTLISRLTGLAREVGMAAAFGTIPAVAAFWMAFRFAHLLRRIFGEGALNAAFIPHFESLRAKDPSQAARFFYDLTLGVALVLLSLIVVLEGVLFFLPRGEVVQLTRILLPSLLFISLYALNTSLLNCERHFFLPSAAPALLNLVWVGALAILWKRAPEKALMQLSVVLVFAFALQWLVTLPAVLKYLKQANPIETTFSGRSILRLLRPFLLAIAGVAATQVNSALDTLFARAASPEGPAYLWYALRLQQLPLALFGLGLTSALLPPMSRARTLESFHRFLNAALKMALICLIPITVAVFVLGLSAVNLIYGHGQFSPSSILPTTLSLYAYGAGLLPMTAILILASACYAKKNYRLPTLLSFGAVALNSLLNSLFIFYFHLGVVSVALATTLTASLQAGLLFALLGQPIRPLLQSIVKGTLCAAMAGVVTLELGRIFFQDATLSLFSGEIPDLLSQTLQRKVVVFAGEALCFAGAFFLSARVLKVEELMPKSRKKGVLPRP